MKEFQKLKEVQTFKKNGKFKQMLKFDKVNLEDQLTILLIKAKPERKKW